MQLKKNAFLFLLIATGLVLRLVWLSDMEWKSDEQWTYTQAHRVAVAKVFPDVGMQSGGGLVNPGMSVAAFALIATITHSPLSMNRVVQIANVAAVLCFLFFALFKVKEKEGAVWLWGIALASVSPLAVLFSRKIWAQDLLPIISFIIIFSNYYRRKPFGAFIWGLAGAIIGQIHMSGFFFAAGLFVFTLMHDHFNKLKFQWIYWVAGSVIGSISIIPWVNFILENPQFTRTDFRHIFQFNFYLYWFLDSQGLNIMYSLRSAFWQFIKEPIVAGRFTYLVAVIHLFLAGAGVVTVIHLWKYVKRIFYFIRNKTPFRDAFINISITRFYLLAILLGLGVFMTLSATTIYTHYLICAFPFSYIFLSKILQNNKRLLKGIILAQLFVTIFFLVYVHQHNGIKEGDYGVTYRAQQK